MPPFVVENYQNENVRDWIRQREQVRPTWTQWAGLALSVFLVYGYMYLTNFHL